jgi:hypothetical protein
MTPNSRCDYPPCETPECPGEIYDDELLFMMEDDDISHEISNQPVPKNLQIDLDEGDLPF